MLLQVGHSAADICIYLYRHVFSFKVNKNKNIPNSSAFLLGGADFSCCFPEWHAPIMSYTPSRFEGRACDPFDCNEDFKGWKTRTAGTFFIRIKKFPVFVCLVCLDFLEDGSDEQKIGKMRDLWGDRKLCVFFEVV